MNESLETLLPPEEQYRNLRALREEFETSIDALVANTLGSGGMPTAEDGKKARAASDAYLPIRAEGLTREECKDLVATYSRSVYDISPPRHAKKHNLGNKFGVFTSAMWDIFPGSDQEHRAFLRKHRAHMHFFTQVAAMGGVPSTPPNYDADFDTENGKGKLAQIREVRDEMANADPLWRVPPKFFLDTSVSAANRILQHYDDDWPGTVEDSGGKVIGYVDKEMLSGMRDSESVSTCMSKDVPWGDATIVNADTAYDWMEKRGKKYVFRHIDGRPPEVIPRSVAVMNNLLPPWVVGKGLGMITYLSVNNHERTMAVLKMLKDENPADLNIMIDPAHGNTPSTEMLLGKTRDLLPDNWLGAGNFNDAKAPFVLRDIIDVIKGPIGLGGVCNTYHTGLRVPDAYALLRVAVAAYEAGVPVLGDGLGGEREDNPRYRSMQMDDSSEWTIKWAIPGIIGQQGGGFHIGRLESCNPFVEHNGKLGRWASGEASNNANQRNERPNGSTSLQKARQAGLKYSEGVEDKFYWVREPAHLSAGYYLIAQRLRSYLSYLLSTKKLPIPDPLEQPGETIRLMQDRAKIIHMG